MKNQLLIFVLALLTITACKEAETNKDTNDYLQQLWKGGELLNTHILRRKDKVKDMHHLIEIYMITANYLVTQISTLSPKIYRTLKSAEENIIKIPDIAYLGMSAAKYEWKKEGDNTYHHTLQLSQYCHFTSPIRRWVDIYHHYILRHPKKNNKILYGIFDLTHLNETHKKLRKLSQSLTKLQLARRVKEYPLHTTAHILNWKIKPSNHGFTPVKFQLYIPEGNHFISHTQKYPTTTTQLDSNSEKLIIRNTLNINLNFQFFSFFYCPIV